MIVPFNDCRACIIRPPTSLFLYMFSAIVGFTRNDASSQPHPGSCLLWAEICCAQWFSTLLYSACVWWFSPVCLSWVNCCFRHQCWYPDVLLCYLLYSPVFCACCSCRGYYIRWVWYGLLYGASGVRWGRVRGSDEKWEWWWLEVCCLIVGCVFKWIW